MKRKVGRFTLTSGNVPTCLPAFRESYMHEGDLEGLMDDIQRQRWDTGILSGPFTAQVNLPKERRVFSIHQARVGSRTLAIKRIG